MKRLLLLVTFSILCLFSFAQTNVQQDNRINPILKSALGARSGYYIYGRTNASGFINIAVLNQSSHTLCWFTCHGRLFDSTKLTNQEFDQVTSKLSDPFILYQNICDKYLADIAAAKDIYRVYGDMQLFDKLNGNYRALFAMETVQVAKTRLQKLIAIENVRKKILTQLAYLNCASPLGLHDDPLYKISKAQAGSMIQMIDSTVYYNIDPTSAVAKISLYKKAAGQLYIQNRSSEIIDSVAIQPEKYDLLQKEKTDVFLLYRGWLELQWQGTLSAIRRQSAGLYNQANIQDEKEVKELYNQLNIIGAKINQLYSPEAKSIEQAVYDTYKNETSEINYIPLLGIGYSLIQTRGQKVYELTNHLGNVLVTVTDKKIGVSSPSNSSLIDHYEPDIVSAQDYYPFGMLQPGRSYLSPSGDKYRYGFNGKENDNEVKGEGNQQDYGMRVYDPRLGRFLSVDPLQKTFPGLTPYQFASNGPVTNIDLDGLERYYYLYEWRSKTGLSLVKKYVQNNEPTFANEIYDMGLNVNSRWEMAMSERVKEYDGAPIRSLSKGIFVRYYDDNNNVIGDKEYIWHIQLQKADHQKNIQDLQNPSGDGYFDGRAVGMAVNDGWNESLTASVQADVSFSNLTNYAAGSPSVGGTATTTTGRQAAAINNGNSQASSVNNNANSTAGQKTILYHYTTAEGQKGILSSKTLNASLKAVNPSDARYGDGQYLSDIAPTTMTTAQLSKAFLNIPFQGKRFTHYVAIDVTGLNVQKGRDGVYVIPNSNSLNLQNRIVGSGQVQTPVKK
ncbi:MULTISPECIES: HYD1 signature containing ADP-ribosyltransferase family protein [Niastella]|uniref:Tox-ART-HYD1 domain-containing protein n=1 Tax=Niastella soli TaxID=2821487 RepID=A0ABS3YZD9_9BACT|nr:HYD1 signature containing ADP-ribosyltransferase family protein [Niastella soli]MBO9203113.1 hypothetical protein [Niastella soli]